MPITTRKYLACGLFLVLLGSLFLTTAAIAPVKAAPAFANDKFKDLWEYSDKRVDEIPGAGRGFTWGPNSFGIFQEDYVEAPGGKRQVQYFDKSRMEVSTNGQYVTNGLLTKELVTGNRQDGDAKFTQLAPSTVQIAGDDNSGGGNSVSPTYASFKDVVSFNPGENAASDKAGQNANLAINKDGVASTLDNPPAAVTIGAFEPTFKHNVPKVFMDFQNQTGLVWNAGRQTYGVQQIYTDNPTANVFGFPVSEAYWVRAVVAGQEKDVLVQLFERRVLTYTPTNNDPFKVEMGNIGQHYYRWRYPQSGSTNPPTGTQPATTTPPVTQQPTTPPTTPPTATTPASPVAVPAANCLPAVSQVTELVQACVSNANPEPNSNVTVYGRIIRGGKILSGVTMNTVWHYKTTDSSCDGVADSNGVASCTKNIGSATGGYTVNIDVIYNLSDRTIIGSTSFTPKFGY